MVDRAIDIVDRFHESILKIERQILIRPKMQSIRDSAYSLPFNHPSTNTRLLPACLPACFSALTLRGTDTTTTRARPSQNPDLRPPALRLGSCGRY